MGGWEWLIPVAATATGIGLSAYGANNQKYSDQTKTWLDQFNQQNGYGANNRDLNAGRSNAFWDMLMNGSLSPSGYMAGAQRAGQVGDDLLGKINQSAGRSAQDIWASFAKTAPGMMDYVNQVTNASMQKNGSSMEDLAKLQSSNAIRGIENMLARSGGSTSGAAMSALARGASEPLLAAQTQLGQQRSNTFNNLFNPLASAGYNQELNRTNELLNALSGANQQMGTYGNIGAALAGLMGSQAEQQILAPALKEDQNLMMILGNALMGTGFKGFGNMTS